jgi:hypothetical protein
MFEKLSERAPTTLKVETRDDLNSRSRHHYIHEPIDLDVDTSSVRAKIAAEKLVESVTEMIVDHLEDVFGKEAAREAEITYVAQEYRIQVTTKEPTWDLRDQRLLDGYLSGVDAALRIFFTGLPLEPS